MTAQAPRLDPVPSLALGPELDLPIGARATFVQFSSAFCTPCRTTRRVLERVVATTDGVAHVELDIADRLALGERLGITATPTVLVLDADGVVRSRATGAPTLAQARAALAAVSGR
jgi:thiol-disulfide isomerase/thioredoxin